MALNVLEMLMLKDFSPVEAHLRLPNWKCLKLIIRRISGLLQIKIYVFFSMCTAC